MNREVDKGILLDQNFEDFDIKLLFNSLIRRKIFIIIISFLSIIYSLIDALTTGRTYQGEFQVALKTDNKSQISNLLTFTPNSIGSQEYGFKTQIQILQSPSVLMDIYKYVQAEKKEELNETYFLKYKKWKKERLDINLEDGTSILNISYKDGDKDLIIPVLKKLSKKYREFSGEKKNNKLIKTQKFLKEQISKYKDKSQNSIAKLQDYASIHDLYLNKGLDKNEFLTFSEASRIDLSNELRVTEEKINFIMNPNNSLNNIISFSLADVDFLKNNINVVELQNLNNNLALLRMKYKDNDLTIQKQEKDKNLLKKNIRKDYENYLNIMRYELKTKIKAYQRPKEVLIEYKKLTREAVSDANALNNLEKELFEISLEQARGYEPYELITEPILLPYPVGPQRKRMVLFGLIKGLILGSLAALAYDRYKNVVYTISQIQSLTRIPLLGELNLKELNNWEDYISQVVNNLSLSSEKNITLYYTSNVKNNLISKIDNILKLRLPTYKINSTYVKREAINNSTIILMIPLASSKIGEIKSFLREASLLNLEVVGFIVIK